MTEKEKMLAGMPYKAGEEELVRDRERAKMLCYAFNHTIPSNTEEWKNILKELMQTEEDMHIEPVFYCDYGYNIKVGKHFYANHNCTILDVNTVTIGDNVMFAPHVQIYTATHPTDVKQRVEEGVEMGYPVVIGDNVWIGGGSIIGPGVTIGKNSVIGAGSVVMKDIPANVVAVGNPCRIVKSLGEQE